MTEIRYKLSELDLLNFQMYTAGSSKQVARRRLFGRFLAPLLLCVFGLMLLSEGDGVVASVFFCFAVIFVVFMPALTKWRYRRHYLGHIREKCQGMLSTEATLRIDEDGLHSKTEDAESSLNFSGIESLAELKGLYLIKLKQSQTLLIPKGRMSGDILDTFMAALATQTNLRIEDHSALRWAEPQPI
jgi:hypothetical protein